MKSDVFRVQVVIITGASAGIGKPACEGGPGSTTKAPLAVPGGGLQESRRQSAGRTYGPGALAL